MNVTEQTWQRLHRFGEKRFLVSICALLFFILATKVWLSHYVGVEPAHPAYGIPVAFGAGSGLALALLVAVNMPSYAFSWSLRLVGATATTVGTFGLGFLGWLAVASLEGAWAWSKMEAHLDTHQPPLAALLVFVLLGVGLWLLASPQLVISFWRPLDLAPAHDLNAGLPITAPPPVDGSESPAYTYYDPAHDGDSGSLAQSWEQALSDPEVEPPFETSATPQEMPEIPRHLLEARARQSMPDEEATVPFVGPKPQAPLLKDEAQTRSMRKSPSRSVSCA